MVVRNFCAYCRREIVTEPDDHAEDCLRDFEADLPVPDPDDVRLNGAIHDTEGNHHG